MITRSVLGQHAHLLLPRHPAAPAAAVPAAPPAEVPAEAAALQLQPGRLQQDPGGHHGLSLSPLVKTIFLYSTYTN